MRIIIEPLKFEETTPRENMKGKCYDHNNKNLHFVEWVNCSEEMPEENKLCAVQGDLDLGIGKFHAIAVWNGRFWKEDGDEFAWRRSQIQKWLLLPEIGNEC